MRQSIGCKYWEKRCLSDGWSIWREFHHSRATAQRRRGETMSHVNAFIVKNAQLRGVKALVVHRLSRQRVKLVERRHARLTLTCFWTLWAKSYNAVLSNEIAALAHYTSKCLILVFFCQYGVYLLVFVLKDVCCVALLVTFGSVATGSRASA